MFITTKNILRLLNEKGVSANKLSVECGLNNAAITEWKKGKCNPSVKALEKIAKYFGLPLSYFYEEHNDVSKEKFPSEEIYYIPVIATVAAGFEQNIVSADWNEVQEVPASIVRGYDKKDLFVFIVSGDSMYPKFLPGDRVLVVRTSSVDSGDIAIVSYADYEDGTIKKVVYEPDCDYVDLIPLNPKYSPVRLYGDQLDGCRICGKVIYLFREI